MLYSGHMISRILVILAGFVIGAHIALAGGNGSDAVAFVPLVGVPGVDNATSFGSYVNALYALAISLAALIAVIKIIIAGAKYMLSDIVSSKSAAKDDIRNSLIGLLIIIGAVVILNTINSDLTNTNISADSVTLDNTPIQLPRERVARALEECASNSNCIISNCETLSNNFSVTGTAYTPSRAQCERVCNTINGTFLDNDRGCLYSQEEYNNAVEGRRTELETTLCTGGSDYDCRIEACPHDVMSDAFSLSGCVGWCQSNGNLTYSSEQLVCYGEFLRDGVIERRILERTCPTGSTCTVEFCNSNDESSYCNRGDTIATFTNAGACENGNGIYDPESDACVFIQP